MKLKSQLLATALTLALTAGVGCANNKNTEADAPPPAAPAAEAAPAAQAAAPAAEPMKARLGHKAPDFTLTDTDGKEVSLADFAGKKVVLEWFNPGCPFVKYAHGEEGPLAKMPQKYMDQGVVWLAINSSAEGKEGYGASANTKARAGWHMDYPVLLDESGDVGRMYGAKTTPHMFIIDEQGMLAYQGALDNAPGGELRGDAAMNYIDQAFTELSAGGKVTMDNTKPYGCGVKYAS